MAIFSSTFQEDQALSLSQSSEDPQIWDSLKNAIANTSGFRRWQLEHNTEHQIKNLTLEQQVRLYLRETLETLAY